ncbi:MAG TPA: RNA polymerase sigma factor [Vicinamibacterales bacterium]|nr:RNA polymerase sigma factor [Vicinamibacterales bacterium]
MEVLSDEELIARYRLAPSSEDSRQFIDELFRRHRTRVIGWCHRLSGNRDLAPDLAQDVFIKAYSSLHTFRQDSRFTTWLYVIARNRCHDEARARSAARREAPDAFDPVTAELNAALAALDARDARTTVQTLMKEVLNETEQRVMTLHYGLEMELGAITTALGLTNTSGAKAFIVSAKRKLNVAVRRWKMKS